jgi:hypothetical protein
MELVLVAAINFGLGARFPHLSCGQFHFVHTRQYEVLHGTKLTDNSASFVWPLSLSTSQSVGRRGPDGSIALHASQSEIITIHYFSHKIKSWRSTDTTDPRAVFKPVTAHKKKGILELVQNKVDNPIFPFFL